MRFLLAAIAAAVVLAAVGSAVWFGRRELASVVAAPDSPPPPRLVVLYAPCTVTTSHLGPYNARVAYTPALNAFAREAVVFERHQGEAGRSAIDYAALFTGTQAMRHRVFANMDPLPDDAYTIAEAFRDGGYDTFFWAGHPFASKDLNFAQGVAEDHLFDGNAGRARLQYHDRGFLRAEEPAFQAILERLRAEPDYRALVMTNFSVSHGPYSTAHRADFCAAYPHECAGFTEDDVERYNSIWVSRIGALSLYPGPATVGLSAGEFERMTRVIELLYASTLFHLDALFGALVETIRVHGLLDQAAIVFTADHGEVLYRPNARMGWSHGYQLAPEELNIPLLIRAPGLSPGVYTPVTRSVDVMPTLMALARIAPPASEAPLGVDLLPALRGAAAPPALRAFSHTTLHPRTDRTLPNPDVMQVAVRVNDLLYKQEYVRGGPLREAVYDLQTDVTEQQNLYGPAHAGMFADLRAYKEELIGAFRGEVQRGRRPALDQAQHEQLRQLGYAHE